mmetsp:Transcript_27134/g.36588  ORF Transcript_27134/g.36588 Transcript_27134/m.36588 type:complete len:229 (+) Transcript_27134:246-932(+)
MLRDVAVLVVVLPRARLGLDLSADWKAQGLRNAGHEACREVLPPLLHAPSNEDDAILARVAGRPRLCKSLVSQHVDALKDEPLLRARYVQHSLHSQEVLRQLLCPEAGVQEVLECEHVQSTVAADTNVGNRAIHLRRVELVELLSVHVLLCKYPVKVEGANVEQLCYRHAGLLTPDDVHRGIELLDAMLDLAELRFICQVHLVEENCAGECNLRAGRALLLRVACALV